MFVYLANNRDQIVKPQFDLQIRKV